MNLNSSAQMQLKKSQGVEEMLSQGLKQCLNIWWEGRANLEELRCMQCIWLTRPHLRVGSGSKGILQEICAHLRPSKGKVNRCFPVFLWLLHLGSSLLQPRTLLTCYHCCAIHCVTALKLGTLELIWCFPCSSRVTLSWCLRPHPGSC